MKKILLLIIAILSSISIFAEGNVGYTILDNEARTVETKAGSISKPGNEVSGDIEIPEKVKILNVEYTVVKIGDCSFQKCDGLTSITLPNTITEIGSDAFYKCTGLISITIPESVESIGSNAFDGCHLKYAEFSSIEHLCSIQYRGFDANPFSSAEQLYINGIGVANITIPNQITSIGDYTFSGCKGLTNIDIPESVTSIGTRAFSNCTGLKNITLPESLVSIGANAFYCCTGLESIIMHNSIDSIGASAFIGCASLTNICVPNSVRYLGESAFSNCTGLISASIGNSVTTILPGTFSSCSSLESITFGNSLSNNGVDIGSKQVFQSCNNLKKLAAPSRVYITNVKDNVYVYYYPSSKCYVEDGYVYTYDQKQLCFAPCSLSGNYILPNDVLSIGNNAFKFCSRLNGLTIESEITSIGTDAFNGCSGLKSLIIGSSLSSLKASDFNTCELDKVAMPSTMENPFGEDVLVIPFDTSDSRIENGCVYSRNRRTLYFAHSTITDEYEIPSTVRTIGVNAFARCSDLTKVALSKNISSIGEKAWDGCNKISIVEYLSETPCEAPRNIFMSNIYDDATLYVPSGCMDAYLDTDPWGYFYNINDEPILGGVEEIIVDTPKRIDFTQPYELFNIQGIRISGTLDEAAQGMYIIRQGAKIQKYILR